MKRFLFSVCALAAVVVGCSKSEVLNRPNAEMPIEFNPYSGRVPVTRAASADIKTLGAEGFQVYAFLRGAQESPSYDSETMHMDKVVTREEGATAWTYPGKAYWPANGVLDFIAYGLNAGATHTQENQYDEIAYVVDTLVANQKDLLVATGQRGMTFETSNNGKVDLVFSHMLSRIGFTLITKEENDVNVRITKVNLEGNFYASGKVDLASIPQGSENPVIVPDGQPAATRYRLLRYPKYPAETTPETTPEAAPETFTGFGLPKQGGMGEPIYNNDMLYTVEHPEDPLQTDYIKKATPTAEETAAAALNEANRYMMIIPIEADKHNAKLKVRYYLPCDKKVHDGEVDLKTVKVTDSEGNETTGFNFEAGKSYNFQFKVSTNKIDFSVTVEDWDTANESVSNQFPIM